MRTYYIYKQTAKLIDVKSLYDIYKRLPFEYIGYVHGTKALYDTFWRKALPWERPYFCNSFVDNKTIFLCSRFSYITDTDRPPRDRYIVTDETGSILDFHALIKPHIEARKIYRNGHQSAYQDHWGSTIPEMRQTITPEEIREIKDEYGITLRPCHPKRNRDPWEDSYCHRISKGWKQQSKRKHQYKPVNM